MASIGGVSVHRFIQGEVQPSGMRTVKIGRAGVSGYDVMQTGSVGEPFQIASVSHYSSESNRHTAHATFNGLRGQIVTVVDNDGRSWTRLLVEDLQVEKARLMANVGGGPDSGGLYQLVCRWTLCAV
jgi:hypothetical protein